MTLTETRRRTCLQLLVVCVAWFALSRPASALIEGGEGNDPVSPGGWPTGAAAAFNATGRIAWWEGPPFGGGEWHAECRGDADAFNQVLTDFAKIEAHSRKLVVHDGIGRSVWLNINNNPEKREAAKIDWTFAVWQLENWKRLRDLPEQFRPPQAASDEVPPPTIDVYVGFNINWTDVRVPEGIDVIDERLEAHGFSIEDGTVLEGTVTGVSTVAPPTITAHLERIETREGKYHYERVTSVEADDTTRWVMKSVQAGWYRVVVEAPGYAPRIAGYQQLDGSPHWAALPTALVEHGTVSGQVLDDEGAGLADVDVRLDDVVLTDGDVYRTADDLKATSDADGRFVFENVPIGRTRIRLHRPGYVGPGLGQTVEVPAESVRVTARLAASALVKVDFGQLERPQGYIVEMEPEGGNVVGSYGGSANLPETNAHEFKNVPAGRYVFFGRPNPGSQDQETQRVTVELRAGETATVTLKAK